MRSRRIQSAPSIGHEFDGKCGVYALIDPKTSKVRYIGQSQDIGNRVRNHFRGTNNNVLFREWIYHLEFNGLYPLIRIESEVDFPESLEVEAGLILEYKKIGQCDLNVVVRGGRELFDTNIDDWIELGKKIKVVEELMVEITQDLGDMLGAKACDKGLKQIRDLRKLKFYLEGILLQRFPEYPFASRVFCGQE